MGQGESHSCRGCDGAEQVLGCSLAVAPTGQRLVPSSFSPAVLQKHPSPTRKGSQGPGYYFSHCLNTSCNP